MGSVEQTPRGLSLEGRVIWVTGAARGIGRGVCEALWESGASVAATDIDRLGANATAKAIRASGGVATAAELDVTDPESIARVLEQVSDELGPIDGLVANAGVIAMDPAIEIREEDWRRQFEVNVYGLFECCRVAAQAMIDGARPGSIVTVASNAGKVGYPNMAAYNASKAAVINLTRSFSAEWARYDINVNAVCPGGVETPMLDDVAAWLAPRLETETADLVTSMRPYQLDRHVQPIEVGRVIAFLLSEDARIIRGQAVNVDGGDTPY